MRKFKRFISLQLSLSHFPFVLVALLFLCAEYKNPFDPKYEGGYNFTIATSTIPDLKDSISLSIFEPCILTMNEVSEVDTFQSFSCIVKDESVAKVDPKFDNDKRKIRIFFFKPCETKIYVNGIRPNEKIVTKEYSVSVKNPYKIIGDSILAKNETGIYEIDKVENASVIESVRWTFGNSDSVKSKDSTFTVFWNEAFKDTVICAELRYNDSANYFLRDTITFTGWIPKIEKVTIGNADTSKKNLNQVDSFKVYLECSDIDSNPYTVFITNVDSTLQKMGKPVFSEKCTLTVAPIKDTTKNSLNIIVVDSTGYSDTCDTSIVIRKVIPVVHCPDTITIAVNDTFVFRVDSSTNCAAFLWKILTEEEKDFANDSSDRDHWKIGPFDSAGTYKMIISPTKPYNDLVITGTCTIIVKEFKYKTIFKSADIPIKVNRPCTLSAVTMKGPSEVTDRIDYKWTIPPRVEKQVNLNGSFAILDFNDSVTHFEISVEGIVGSDTAEKAILDVNTMRFSPTFSFVENTCTTIVHSAYKFIIKDSLTDPEKTPVIKYFYKVLQSADSSEKEYDTIKGITFRDTGTYTIQMWCVDRDSAKSNKDTVSVIVSANMPFIKSLDDKDTIDVAIKRPVRITEIVANPGESGSPIESIMWDQNGDGIYENSMKATGNDTIVISTDGYTTPQFVTVAIKCKDQNGDTSLPVRKFINVISDKPEINNCKLKDTLIKYIHNPVDLITNITDPDNRMLFLTITANDTVFTDSVRNNLDTTILQFNKAGSYTVTLYVNDTAGNKDTFLLQAPIVIDSGIPIISNFNIKEDFVYINDTITCSIAASDPNGSIKEYRYYINSLDSTPTIKTDTSAFVWTFKDTGTYKIYAAVVDTDNFSSLVKYDSVVVRRGQPVVESFTVDIKSIYVNDSCTFKMVASDVNGKIIRRELKWNDKKDSIVVVNYTAADSKQTFDDSVGHRFSVSDTNLAVVQVRVMDDDNIYSEWKACSLSVKKGIPRIDSIGIESKEVIYIKDSLKLIIKASDPNNKVQSVRVSWRNDTSFIPLSYKDEIAAYEIKKSFTKEDTLIDSIRIRVVDTTGFLKDSLYKMTVLPGYPVIDAISLTEVWIKDANTFTITAHDVNSKMLDTFKISFDSSKTWTINKDSTFTGISFQDTSRTGLRDVRVRVCDKDSLWTEKKFTLNVKLGRPVLAGANSGDSIQWVKGAVRDTMFYKWRSGDTYVRINATDPNPNGKIVRYDWNRRDDGTIDYPNDSATLFKYFVPDTAELLSVRVRDNDSLWSNKLVFYVFPDGPPPAITTTSDAGQGARIIKWSGKDTKDGNNTLYKIVVKKGTASAVDSVTQADEANPAYIISDFKTGTQYETDNAYDYKFNYTPTQSGRIYHYRIIAKDARGSESRTAGDPQFSF